MAVEGAASTNSDFVLASSDLTSAQIDLVTELVRSIVPAEDQDDIIRMLGLKDDD